MMKNSKSTRTVLLFCFALAIGLNSCKEQNDPHPEGSELFVQKSWGFSAMTISPAIDWDLDGTPDTDILALTDACDRDNLVIFGADNKTTTVYGKVKCDDDEPDKKVDGTWKYDKADNKLVINDDESGEEIWTVIQNDGNTLKMKAILPGVTPEYTITMTLKSVL